MFRNAGGKLQATGIMFFVLFLLGGIAAAIALSVTTGDWYYLPIFVGGGFLIGWLIGLLLHGFGSIVAAFETPSEKEPMKIKSFGDIFFNDAKAAEEE